MKQPQTNDDGKWKDVPNTRLTLESSETSNTLDEAPVRSSTPATPRSATRRHKVGRRRPILNFDREQIQDTLAHTV